MERRVKPGTLIRTSSTTDKTQRPLCRIAKCPSASRRSGTPFLPLGLSITNHETGSNMIKAGTKVKLNSMARSTPSAVTSPKCRMGSMEAVRKERKAIDVVTEVRTMGRATSKIAPCKATRRRT